MFVNTYGIKNSRPVGGPGNLKELKNGLRGISGLRKLNKTCLGRFQDCGRGKN
jgi:hypothetical protein